MVERHEPGIDVESQGDQPVRAPLGGGLGDRRGHAGGSTGDIVSGVDRQQQSKQSSLATEAESWPAHGCR